MIVQVATLDILTQRAHLDPEVARAIGDAIAMEVEIAREPLATQQELVATKQELKHGIQELRQEMHAGFAQLKHEITEVRSEMRVELSVMRAEISDLRFEVKNELAEFRTHLEAKIGEMARWMLGGFISFFLALLGSVYFTIQHVR